MNIGVDILAMGINNGFLFIPFAIGIGLIYHNLKEIDVSIDGVIVLSGISAAFVWNFTGSYFLSILGGVLTGIFCSAGVSIIQTILAVPPLMSGLIFSLIAHTVSIYWIGESTVLKDTRLISAAPEEVNIQLWHGVILVLCYFIPSYIYNSHIGFSIRKLGNNVVANLSYSKIQLKLIAYSLSGGIYGIGAAIFVHSRGMAGGGVAFEFLIQALTAYLLVGKLMPRISAVINRFTENIKTENLPEQVKVIQSWISIIMSKELLKAPLGAICLEVIVMYLIVLNLGNNPYFWKLILSGVLLWILSSTPELRKSLGRQDSIPKPTEKGIKINSLKFSYGLPLKSRKIFSNVDTLFSPGLSMLSGANGSGKTTLLKLIAGELEPQGGNIYYNHMKLNGLSRHSRPVFILMQNPLKTLIAEMSVSQNLFLASYAPNPFLINRKDYTLQKMLDQLRAAGINIIKEDDKIFWQLPVQSLSGGEAYCVAIYCAILSGRSVILADEPTTGLDSANYNMVRDALNSFSGSEEYTVIVVTHDDRLKDISSNKYSIKNRKLIAQLDWWDARFRDTFFAKVYKLGDNSVEGHLAGKELDLFDRTQREIKLIESVIGSPAGKRILDCPCGYGRHSIKLADLGANVVGVDISPEFIRDANHKATSDLPKEKRPLFLEGDMKNLPPQCENESFDCCINMFLAFGFFEDDDKNEKTLKEFWRILKPGGQLIIHTDVNPDLIKTGKYADRRRRTLPYDQTLVINDEFNRTNKRLEGTWTILNQHEVPCLEQKYSIRIYSHAELDNMLRKAGFSDIQIQFPQDSQQQEVIYRAIK